MSTVSRWIAPAVLAAGLGMAAMSPTTAHAQVGDNLVRVVVDVADVVLRSGTPYYRNGGYGYDDRLIMERDRYGRPVYYREVARQRDYRSAPPYGNAYGYHRNTPNRQVKCNKHGKCKTTYYDARHDRDGDRYDSRYDNRYDNRYYSYGRDDRHRDRDDD
jgi:hypothetical protein